MINEHKLSLILILTSIGIHLIWLVMGIISLIYSGLSLNNSECIGLIPLPIWLLVIGIIQVLICIPYCILIAIASVILYNNIQNNENNKRITYNTLYIIITIGGTCFAIWGIIGCTIIFGNPVSCSGSIYIVSLVQIIINFAIPFIYGAIYIISCSFYS